jgi:hypothetical protein
MGILTIASLAPTQGFTQRRGKINLLSDELIDEVIFVS